MATVVARLPDPSYDIALSQHHPLVGRQVSRDEWVGLFVQKMPVASWCDGADAGRGVAVVVEEPAHGVGSALVAGDRSSVVVPQQVNTAADGGAVFAATQGDVYATVNHEPTPMLGLPHSVRLDEPIVNLPKVPARVFVGRDDVLAVLDAVAVDGSAVVTQTVAGLGGVGKTEVVLQYCHQHRGRYPIVWWVSADSPERIEAGLAGLAGVVAARTGRVAPGVVADAAGWAVAFLAAHPGWLLVLDNVDQPAHVEAWLAQLSGGRVLVTSRRDVVAWRDLVDVSVRLDLLDPEAAVRLLIGRSGQDDVVTAGLLAVELGFLPLALTAAAAYLAQTRTSMADYLDRLRRQPAKVLAAGAAVVERIVGRVWDITLAAVNTADPLAIDVLRVLSMLGADDVPRDLLAPMADDPVAVEVALGLLASYSMVTLTPASVSTHRLVQAVVAGQAEDAGVGAVTRHTARNLITQARPRTDPTRVVDDWPRWARLVPHIQALAQRWPDTDPDTDLADLLVGAGLYLSAHGLNIAKIEADSRALTIYEAARGSSHPSTLNIRNNLAAGYQAVGRYTEAITLHEQTLADRIRILGPDHPDTLTSRNNLANGYRAVGRHAEAITLDEQTLAVRNRIFGPDHPDTLGSRNNLATGYHDAGRYAEAIGLQEQTLADRTRILGPDHPDTLASRNSLSSSYWSAGRLDESNTLDEQNLADRARILGPDHPDTMQSRRNLAIGYQAVGRHAEAITLWEQTLADRTRILGPDHPNTQDTRNTLEHARQSDGTAPDR